MNHYQSLTRLDWMRKILIATSVFLSLALLLMVGVPAIRAAEHSPLDFSPNAPAQPQAVIPACDPIASDTTWTTGNIYVVNNCDLVINAGATLTIQPGVIVKFWGIAPGYASATGSVAVIVDGTLNAAGTESQPVVFTSYADDAHGGNTNGDGASSGVAGDWYGIVYRPGGGGSLDHFFVGYAGSGVFNNTLGYGRSQIDLRSSSPPINLSNGTVTNGLTKGIYLEGAGITPVIESVLVANNKQTNSTGSAVYQYNINMQPSYAKLTFSGNDRNEVTIGRFGDAMNQDVTLGGINYGFDCGYTLCEHYVPISLTLTVKPGTLLDFGYSFGIAVQSGGSLIADGTPTEPITFTSKLAAAGADEYWNGLWAQYGSTLRLDHVDVSYARDTNYGKGLQVETDDALVSNSKIHHNKATGIYSYNTSGSIHPVFTQVDVTDNGELGVYMYPGSGSTTTLTWDGGSISRNGFSGLWAGTSNGLFAPTLRNLIIADNGAMGDSDNRWAGIYLSADNIHPTLENLTITGNVGNAIFWYCNGSIVARNLTAAGNGKDEILLPGCTVTGGRRWDLGDAGLPVLVTNHITVDPNGLLSILPGSNLRFDKNQYNSPVGLYLEDNSTLYAMGTAEKPVVFTGSAQEAGWWRGIEAKNRSEVVLHHCEIAYGGGSGSGSLIIRWGLSGGVPASDIQNCEIHHSLQKGVHFDFNGYADTPPPVFRYNNIHDNVQEGVANWNAPPLDARDNYWGDPTGPYHPTKNPPGLGDAVGDDILFNPWLGVFSSGQPVPGEMLVSTGAPSLVSPGETVDYAIQYLNEMTETVKSSILMLQLPKVAYFVDSTQGAIYWPDRHQLIWKLGDLAPGDSGYVSARVRFQWGLAWDYTDGSYTQFAGENYNTAALDVAEYNAYESPVLAVTKVVEMNAAAFATVRGANSDLESLYQAALSAGFVYMSAARVTYADGTEVVNAALRTPDRKFGRILSLSDGKSLASTVGGGKLDLRDTTGGMTADLNTQTYEFWGSWKPTSASALLGATACDENRCFYNCMIKAKSWGTVARKVAGAVSWVIPPLGAVWTGYEVYDEITTYLECKDDCRLDPGSHCCKSGDTRWSPTGLKQQCAKYSCDAVGTWKNTPDKIDKCGSGERCVAGSGSDGGCKACEEEYFAATYLPVRLRSVDAICAASGNPNCKDLAVRRAKDPNALYGPAGDLLPGQTVTYTITYENEGEGIAYGVFVTNPLPEVFNAGTINFVKGSGVYLPETREIVWQVGELKPKGSTGSQGVITYSVALTGGLPSGTVVSNQAVVNFQSVPEETPTNAWVNLVAPLVATPQTLSAAYQTRLNITLSGREISGGALSYEIVEKPYSGLLTGLPPNVTYTPAESFTGADAFTFRVSNGTSTSRSAQVLITVTPEGDIAPPQVLWTSPESGETGVDASPTPVLTDTLGPVYSPVVLIGVSELLSETTVTTATVTLTIGGAPVAASVYFDSSTYQIVLLPRVALRPGRYSVLASIGLTDLAGNPLSKEYQWSFDVAAAIQKVYLPLTRR